MHVQQPQGQPQPQNQQPVLGSAYISFTAEVTPATIEPLLALIAQQVQQGVHDIHLLLSTPGGSVASGITVYNMLRSLPITLTTYNMGNVDSIGNVIYLAGQKRIAVPASRFMFHGVGITINGQTRFEEKNLLEILGNMRNDQGLIAKIIQERTNMKTSEVHKLFLRAAFLTADDAKKRGIVHEVRDVNIPRGAPIFQLVFQR